MLTQYIYEKGQKESSSMKIPIWFHGFVVLIDILKKVKNECMSADLDMRPQALLTN